MTKEPQTGQVVLVVEDDPLVLMMAVDLVAEAEFHAISARNADDAIRILEQRSDIRIIFTDIHMPGSMDGLKLAHAVRDRWPPVEIIVTSALAPAGKEQLPERGIFLLKPYTGAQIAGALQKLAA